MGPDDATAPPVAADVEIVVDPDPARAGAVVRGHLDGGARVAGFVGEVRDPAVAEFVADVVRPER